MTKLIFISLFLIWGCSKEEVTNEYQPTRATLKGNDLVFFNLVNEYRDGLGLPLLTAIKSDGCNTHSVYMWTLDYPSHDYFWRRSIRANANYFGEVVAYGFVTPESLMSAYLGSPPHLEVLINPNYTHISIAHKGLYQCVNFAGYGGNNKNVIFEKEIIK